MIHDRRLGRPRPDSGAGGAASDGSVGDGEGGPSVGVTIPSEVSALLLTVVILGVCVAAVVVDVLWESDQPATDAAGSHRDYGGPWLEWLRAARDSLGRLGARCQSWASAAGRGVTGLVRGAAAGSDAGRQAARESLEAIAERRRARAQRQAAHARYVQHLEAQSPPPNPLPPLPPAYRAPPAGLEGPPPSYPPDPWAPPLGHPTEPQAPPWPPPAQAADTVEQHPPADAPTRVTPDGQGAPEPWTEPAHTMGTPVPQAAGEPPGGQEAPEMSVYEEAWPPTRPLGPLVRDRPSPLPDQRRGRRRGRGPISPRPPIVLPPRPSLTSLRPTAERPPDRTGGVPLQPPPGVRIRSAAVLVVVMAMLGVLTAGLILAAVLVVVQALAGL
jgi:hypothetical protein